MKIEVKENVAIDDGTIEDKINEGEMLFRAALPVVEWYPEEDIFSASLFKDRKGVSVDRDGNRADNEIIDVMKERFKKNGIKGVVKVGAGYCIALPTHLIPKKEPDNTFHAEIHDSPDKVKLERWKMLKLCEECEVIHKNL